MLRSVPGVLQRLLAALLLVAVLPLSPLTAQRSDNRSASVTVTGVAYDSLRGTPLANAFVILTERSRSTTSDERGQFRFDSVPAGTYTFAMQHDVFDSLGLSGTSARVTVTDGRTPVVLAVPSLAALWRTACAGIPLPQRDTGFVFGTIRDAVTRRPMSDAWVELSWLELVKLDMAKASTNINQRRWKSEAQANADGGYAICGVPVGSSLSVRAASATGGTPNITLPGASEIVQRFDVVVSGTTAADAQRRGLVRGTVVDKAGKGVRDIRVKIGVEEVLSDAGGKFLLRNVPTGTNQIEAAAVGFNPTLATVDVYADDTTNVTLGTYRVSALDTMRVLSRVSTNPRVRQIIERRVQGFGTFVDSTQVGRSPTLSAAMQTMPGVTIQQRSANGRRFDIYLPSTGTGNCLANIMFDGLQQPDSEILNTIVPSEIAVIEVYQQRTTVPTELLRPQQSCGLVVIWTKRALR